MMTMSPTDAQLILKGAEVSGEDLSIGYRRALETIAGMREEWGVKWNDDPNGPPDWGFPTRAEAERWEKKHRHRGPGRGRIVRRYVTKPEEA